MQLADFDQEITGILGRNIYDLLYTLSELKGKSFSILKSWLEKFGYSYRWDMKGVNRGEFLLKDLKSGIESNLVDNGYGISQSLPLAALDLIEGKTVLVDSPEAFLQTGMQSEMGDLLIEGSKNGRILLETGSEYLMLRIRRRVAEGLIAKEEISIYYLEESKAGQTACYTIRLDDLGEFEDMPESFIQFFSSDFQDIEKINAVRREKLCRKEL